MRGEVVVAYKFQRWQEGGGRVRVDAHYAQAEAALGTDTTLRVMGVVDTIAGATPTGAPPPAGSDAVPLADFDDRREAWQVEAVRAWGRYRATVGTAHSRESDYVSHGVSATVEADFNQRNTTVRAGFAYTDDAVTAPFLAREEGKRARDFLVGVTQLLGPESYVTANLTVGRTEGYLSDPYKLVQKTVEVFPGLSLPLTFPENRPPGRDRRIAHVAFHRGWERLGAATEVSYRLADDSFGTRSHTVAVEWFQELGERVIVRPGVRWYRQSAADFYEPDLDRSPVEPVVAPLETGPFYSSDYRLAALETWIYGLKVIWSPSDSVSLDATYERYHMAGRDGVTAGSAFADADVVTVGFRLSH